MKKVTRRWFVAGIALGGVLTTALGVDLALHPAAAAETQQKKISSFGEYEGYTSAAYSSFVRQSLYVPTRDGTKLAVDIYRPAEGAAAAAGKKPAVLELTRYWRAQQLPDGRIKTPAFGYLEHGQSGAPLPEASNWAVELVRHGYVVVVGDMRGTGSSFGKNPGIYTATEARDTHDLIEWIAAQTWSDGKVGMVGASYTGTNQITGLTNPAPHLRAIFPAVPNFELFKIAVNGGVFRKGGILNMYRTLVALGTANEDSAPMPPAVDGDSGHVLRDQARGQHETASFAGYTAFLELPELGPVAKALDLDTVDKRVNVLAFNNRLIPEIASHPDLQRALMSTGYFRNEPTSFDFSAPGSEPSISPASELSSINRAKVPAYLWSGWQDVYPADAFLFFANLKTPGKLAVGPWAHYPDKLRGDLREEESIRLRAVETLRWFDHWLKDIDNGIMTEPKIHYAVVESPQRWEWRSTDKWPLPEAKKTAFYFADGPAKSVRSVNDGVLTTASPPKNGGMDSYYVDYTATTGKTTRFHYTTGGPTLAYPNMAENDAKGLTYTTPSLTKDLVVAGHPIVTLYVTSSAADAEFDAYIEDVDPYGYSTFVTEGSIRALNRTTGKPFYDNLGLPWPTDSRADALKVAPLSAGIAEITLVLQPMATRFKAGHRLRVTLQGADADGTLTFPVVPPPKVSVLHDSDHASRVVLPLLEN